MRKKSELIQERLHDLYHQATTEDADKPIIDNLVSQLSRGTQRCRVLSKEQFAHIEKFCPLLGKNFCDSVIQLRKHRLFVTFLETYCCLRFPAVRLDAARGFEL